MDGCANVTVELHPSGRMYQRFREGMLRSSQEVWALAVYDLPRIKNCHSLANRLKDSEIVGNDQNGGSVTLIALAQ